MKVLYHECTDELGRQLPVEFCDGNGKLWVVPFGEPTDFEDGFMADKIVEHLRYMGLVEVHFNKTRTGIEYDMDDAKKRAAKVLLAEEKACINSYVQNQLETRTQKNYPPLPPVGRALSCVIKHKVNLLAYGLRPVGWEPPYEMKDAHIDPVVVQAATSGNVDDRIRQMENLLISQQNLINNLIQTQSSGGMRRSAKSTPAAVLEADTKPEKKVDPASIQNDGAEDTVESINL